MRPTSSMTTSIGLQCSRFQGILHDSDRQKVHDRLQIKSVSYEKLLTELRSMIDLCMTEWHGKLR